MRVRIPLSLLLVALAWSAAAQYTYIVPVNGFASGFESGFFTNVVAFNPNRTAATLRYEAIYPATGAQGCRLPAPETILPHRLVGLSPACYDLDALLLTSDQPLKLIGEVYASFYSKDAAGNSFGRSDLEPFEVATDWIPADQDAMIPLVRILTERDKANLILVNPNDFRLTVTLHVERPELNKVVDSIVQVEPRTFLMTRIAPIPTPPGDGIPIGYSAIHEITLRANGKFQAGVSNSFGGVAAYRSAVPLQP